MNFKNEKDFNFFFKHYFRFLNQLMLGKKISKKKLNRTSEKIPDMNSGPQYKLILKKMMFQC